MFAHNPAETGRQYPIFAVDPTARMTGRSTFPFAKVGAPIRFEKQE